MSIHVCSECGHSEHIFGDGGANRIAQNYDVPLLGQLPLDVKIREQCDEGKPAVASDPNSKVSEIYFEIATRVAEQLAVAGGAKVMPNISISDD